jgi:signal transduction histidine kinase
MSSMRERAAELGGDLIVETSAGGTVVSATLPLESK